MYMTETHKNMDSHSYKDVHDENPYKNIYKYGHSEYKIVHDKTYNRVNSTRKMMKSLKMTKVNLTSWMINMFNQMRYRVFGDDWRWKFRTLAFPQTCIYRSKDLDEEIPNPLRKRTKETVGLHFSHFGCFLFVLGSTHFLQSLLVMGRNDQIILNDTYIV